MANHRIKAEGFFDGNPDAKATVEPTPPKDRPKFMVTVRPGVTVPVYTPEESVDEKVKVFERDRLLATSLVCYSKLGPPPAAPRSTPVGAEELAKAHRDAEAAASVAAHLLNLVVAAHGVVTDIAGHEGKVETMAEMAAIGARAEAFLAASAPIVVEALARAGSMRNVVAPTDEPKVKL